MKKLLLSITAIAAAATAFAYQKADPSILSDGQKLPACKEQPALTRADEETPSMDFTYASEPYNAYSLNGTTGGVSRVYLAFELTADDVKAFAGSKVTGFSVLSPYSQTGTNTITDARFFYSFDLAKEDYSQDFKMSGKALTKNAISIDEPYTITGQENGIVFGYSFIVPKNDNMGYLVTDGMLSEAGTCLGGVTNVEAEFPEFFTLADQVGALCMWIKLEGDNLPKNIASIVDIDTPPYLPISGNGKNFAFLVKNQGANKLSSLEATVSITGMPDLVQTFDFTPISFGEYTELTFDGVKANEEGFVDFSLQITKVNGVAFEGNKFTASVPAYDSGFLKKIVAEDATGTWCGWCPGGIEALEYLKTTYPEKAIAIGVHCSNGDSIDPMEIEEYLDFIYDYVSGFPCVWYNRTIDQTPTSTYDKVCQYIDQIAAYFDYPSYAQVSLEGKTSDDGATASVTASAEFKLATKVPHYLSFVVVEDGVGPYIQQNYFKQQRVAMNGWEKKGSVVSTIYNDVARYYDCYPGIKGSLPETIEANSINTYTVDLPLANVTGNEYRVIALITNAKTGEIVNATEYNMTKDNTILAVDDIATDDAPAEYYNLNGQKVADPSNGIFIKKTGAKAEKVIIR